ncbi:unnamed protein product [Cercospora beticola]|nr:unnamed protein product [Cercospora beticola]
MVFAMRGHFWPPVPRPEHAFSFAILRHVCGSLASIRGSLKIRIRDKMRSSKTPLRTGWEAATVGAQMVLYVAAARCMRTGAKQQALMLEIDPRQHPRLCQIVLALPRHEQAPSPPSHNAVVELYSDFICSADKKRGI